MQKLGVLIQWVITLVELVIIGAALYYLAVYVFLIF